MLFDIDGTLVGGINDSTLVVGATEDRFVTAISNAYGLNVRRDKDFRGSTDKLILASLLSDEGWDEQQIQSAMPQLIEELDRVHDKTFRPERLRLLPGVKELLDTLSARKIGLGLITGNLQPVAKRKLEALGVWPYFSVGGFGSDPHIVRADLVKIATVRGGFADRLDDVVVIGDTQKDIQATHEAGVIHSIGVVNGYRKPQELIAAGAEVVLDDLVDTTRVLAILNIEG